MDEGVIEEMGTPEQVFNNPTSPRTEKFLRAAREGF
jgi:ABC-type histidine transport system ATPase subunit